MKDLKRTVTVDLSELLPRWEKEIRKEYDSINYNGENKEFIADYYAFLGTSMEFQLVTLCELGIITDEEYSKLYVYFSELQDKAAEKIIDNAFKGVEKNLKDKMKKYNKVDFEGFDWENRDFVEQIYNLTK